MGTSAVYVEDAMKSYGTKPVLKQLCMNVPKGSIYGLLGASGCGKTTLLSCIVGQRELDKGEIWVLGGKPGMEGSGVPGPNVGYMPQEIALVNEFTIKDTIYYFGRIYDMDETLIEERLLNLSTLFELPPKDRLVKHLSGGQQRRVSLAAAMVHMPDLLILDEPTVGVDPILREKIWDYLVQITRKDNIAVIITTHYIEEARQANVIGLMRDGRLLAEESPAKLLSSFQVEFLEDVFLILSQRQNEGVLNDISKSRNQGSELSLMSLNTTQGSTDELHVTKSTKKPKKVGGFTVNRKRMRALLDKNWKQFYRNTSGVIFVLIFPIIQTLIFMTAVGGDITDINLAIVNKETMTTFCSGFNKNESAIPYSYASCHFYNISCRFLTFLEDPMIHKIYYDSISEAMEDVKHGKTVGVLYLANNITESLEERIEKGKDVDDSVLDSSEIQVWLDMSNRQIGAALKYKLLGLYVDFQKDLSKDCKIDPKLVEIVNFKTIHGDLKDTYRVFVTPGLVLTMAFFMMALMSCQIIITDRSEGVWDRSTIAGVSSLEISLSHIILQCVLVAIYTADILLITFYLFDTDNAGSMTTIILLTFLQGMAGMFYGFWISIISINASMANIVSTGSFYIMILMSGVMWPIEGMPVFLQWISRLLPFTVAIDSFRNVMKKGWRLQHLEVANGIGIEILWIIFLAIVNTLLIKIKR